MSTVQKIIKNKVGLLNLAEELGNVSRACKVMGYSRDTFYRYKQAVDEGGVEALIDKSRRKPNLRNRTAPEIEEAIIRLWIEKAGHMLDAPVAQPPEVQLAGHARHHARVRRWLDNFLDIWLPNGA